MHHVEMLWGQGKWQESSHLRTSMCGSKAERSDASSMTWLVVFLTTSDIIWLGKFVERRFHSPQILQKARGDFTLRKTSSFAARPEGPPLNFWIISSLVTTRATLQRLSMRPSGKSYRELRSYSTATSVASAKKWSK